MPCICRAMETLRMTTASTAGAAGTCLTDMVTASRPQLDPGHAHGQLAEADPAIKAGKDIAGMMRDTGINTETSQLPKIA